MHGDSGYYERKIGERCVTSIDISNPCGVYEHFLADSRAIISLTQSSRHCL